jgi:hypothetical protein
MENNGENIFGKKLLNLNIFIQKSQNFAIV